MTESTLAMVFLGIISLCVVILTAVALRTARDVRHTLHELHQTLGELRHVLARANRMTRSIEEVVQQAYRITRDVMEPVVWLTERAHAFFSERFGNGARSEPRRRYRE